MSLFGGELKLWSAYSSCLLFTINYKIWCENDSYSFWNGSGRWAQLAVTTCLQHNPSGRHRPETHLFVQSLLWPITQDTLKEGGRFSLESCELSLLPLTIGSSLPVTARLSWDFRASETWFQKGLNYRTLMSISVWIVFQNVARHLPLPVSGKTSTLRGRVVKLTVRVASKDFYIAEAIHRTKYVPSARHYTSVQGPG